jgi:uncharacterized protein
LKSFESGGDEMFYVLIVSGVIAMLLLYSYRNTFCPILREVTIHIRGKDEKIEDLRVLQLSDLHMERISISSDRLKELILPTLPDLIVLTGDYLDRYHNISKLLTYLQKIQEVKPRYGVYCVFGNHDHYLGERIDELQKAIESTGCKVLRNESITVDIDGVPLNLIGIDDYCLGKSDIPRSFENVPNKGINLVLAHDPNTVLDLEEHHDVDYMLSGHLHGGQFNIPFAFKLFPMGELPKYKIIKGLHRVNGRTIYISEGLGQSGLNVRLNSRPEITVHRLRVSA